MTGKMKTRSVILWCETRFIDNATGSDLPEVILAVRA
jgi:hypothetical protein